jgi:hypothetical protein
MAKSFIKMLLALVAISLGVPALLLTMSALVQ